MKVFTSAIFWGLFISLSLLLVNPAILILVGKIALVVLCYGSALICVVVTAGVFNEFIDRWKSGNY
jgi:hypothetical protein